MSEYTLGELTKRVGGELRGDAAQVIRSASTLEDAKEGQVTFLANRRYEPLLRATEASAVFVNRAVDVPVAQIITENPYYAFTQAVVLLHGYRRHRETGVSARASVDPSARVGAETHVQDFATVSAGVTIGDRCVLYPNVFVGPDTTIGDDCILYPGVVVYDDCRIGNRVILQANVTVGEDGFGFATHRGVHHKIPHIGRVIVEDDVEIGAGSGIERGAVRDTILGRGTKLGDMVAIGHGVQVGPGCLIVAFVGIAGSTTLGHHCMVGGQVGVAGHLKIGNLVTIGAKSGVHHHVPDGQRILGYPAMEARHAADVFAVYKSLPSLRRRVLELEARLAKLEAPKQAGRE